MGVGRIAATRRGHRPGPVARPTAVPRTAAGPAPAAVPAVPAVSTGPAVPAPGVTARLLAQGTTDGAVAVRSTGRTDVVMREITIQPGGSTGWHYHHGQLIAVVQSGTLTRTLADRTVQTTTAGQSFVEPAGPRQVHNARNLGTEPVVLYVTYVLPAGSPLAVEAADPAAGGPDRRT
ncbi:cupin domain-containing protein [Kitasatospora sp. NPDC048540]|uniref:cupin domain-containing protein n=1 Tax=Kitasatospora sp. NPDC048540 TaxID=3155634 RepID=UPI0033ED5D08